MATAAKDASFSSLPLAGKLFILVVLLGVVSAIYYFAFHMQLAEQIEGARDRAVALRERAAGAMARSIARHRARTATLGGRLDALSPLATLSRGFAVALGPDGRLRGRAAQFTAGDAFELVLRDGRVAARADGVHLTEPG
jgi:exonuclease VII large subunit